MAVLTVVSYEIDSRSGIPNKLSSQPTRGGEPCHLCIDPSDRWLIVANHEHGSVPVFPIDADGRLDIKDIHRQMAWYKAQGLAEGPVGADVAIDRRYVIPLRER